MIGGSQSSKRCTPECKGLQDEEIVHSDGDMVSCKPVMSVEANEECEKRINSVGYYVGVDGKFLRVQERDFLLCAYTITNTDGKVKLTENPNKEKIKYVI